MLLNTRKIISILFAVIMLQCILVITSFADGMNEESEKVSIMSTSVSGIGTAENPYLITSQSDLMAIANEELDNALTSHYKLMNDIKVTYTTWVPIGNITGFSGVFDGNGYKISGITLAGGYTNIGFFGTNNGTIKNLTLDVTMSGSKYIGGLAAINNGYIENCLVTGYLNATEANNSCIGGLVGKNENSILSSGAVVTIDGKGERVGGLAGMNTHGNNTVGLIKNSYARGIVSSSCDSSYVGGLVGYSYQSNNQGVMIKYCYAACSVTGGTYSVCGGVLGKHYSGIVTASYYDVTVSGQSDTTKGTPVTTDAMKLDTAYAGWDFDTIWSISEDINDGYPHIKAIYKEETENLPYTINSLNIINDSYKTINYIPDTNFIAELNVKNNNYNDSATFVVAAYDNNDNIICLSYMYSNVEIGDNVSLGTTINNPDGSIHKIKAFVWKKLGNIVPLAKSVEITK